MFSMIKFCLTFSFSFLLLSIPIKEKPLFLHLDEWARPFTSRVFKHSKIVFWESVEDGKQFGQKIFNNNLPQQERQKEAESGHQHDHIHTKSSALEKDDHMHSYTDEERDMLKKILINSK